MDKYCMYLRKSRKDLEAEKNGEGETLARHKRILSDYAAKNGLHIAHIYQEIVSGDTIAARPQVQQMIQDCYAGKYRGILVVDPDRLGRGNQGDMQTFLDCFKYSNNRDGLLVITPTKTYDVAHNSDDERYMEFVMFFSRQEFKTIRERYDRGKKQAVIEGNYVASLRPYGYDKVSTKTSKTLAIRPDEAAIVKKIFEWKVYDHITPGEMARRLTAMGVPTYKGGEWTASTIKSILQNVTYTGKVRWNDRMQVKTMVDGKLVESRPRSNHTSHYMEYEGKHEAIISDELFRAAQASFYSDKTKAHYELANPLAGILVCKKCGYAMVYNSFKHKKNVKPRIMHRQSQVCNVKSAFLDDVLNAFIAAIQQHIDHFELQVESVPDVDEKEIRSQIADLEKERKKILAAIDRISEAYEEGVYTSQQYFERTEKRKENLAYTDGEIAKLEASIPDTSEQQAIIKNLYDILEIMNDAEMSASAKNKFLKKVIDKVEFSRDNNNEFVLDIYVKRQKNKGTLQ